MAANVSIVDVGVGNVQSIWRSLDGLGARASLAANPAEVRAAERLVLPGVGHFGSAMARLRSLGFAAALEEAVQGRKVPVLGICLGMHLMAGESEEGGATGLGWLDARVVRLQFRDPQRYKVPQIGWNGIAVSRPGRLLKGVDPAAEFYLAHSYVLECAEPGAVSASCAYEQPVTAVIERGNLFGTQFHPEKSRAAGLAVLSNFLAA